MSLLDNYKIKSKSPAWKAEADFSAHLFDFTAVFPDMFGLEKAFKNFSAFSSKTLAEQEKLINRDINIKDQGVNLIRARLFVNRGGAIVRSSKGETYAKFLKNKFSFGDRWFLNFLFVVDSYFSLSQNYVFAQSQHLMSLWQKAGYSTSIIYNALYYLFSLGAKPPIEKLLMSEFVIMLSCLHDPEFLRTYNMSSEFEKNELHEYIINNYKSAKGSCFISSKFKAKKTEKITLIDDAKILYFSHYLICSRTTSMEEFFDIFAQEYKRFFKLNIKRVSAFLLRNEDVFKMSYVNIFSDLDDFIKLYEGKNSILPEYDDEPEGEQQLKGDYTTFASVYDLATSNAKLSLKAKETANFKCELESENNCNYFLTPNKKPYLEVHLLIPRQFASEFSVSLERASNYVCLCPSCHRLLHNAKDEEKLKNVLIILRKRFDMLAAEGLNPSRDLLLSAYNISHEVAKNADLGVPLLKEATLKIGKA